MYIHNYIQTHVILLICIIIHRLQTYVAECMGVHVVGYAIMVYGLGSSLGSFISGKLLSLGIKIILVLGILTLHLTLIIFLAIWEREPLLLLLISVIFLWGTCDGSWMTVCCSKCISKNLYNYM